MNIETERLQLIPIKAGKFDEVYKVFTDEFVRKYLCDDTILSKTQIQSFIETSNETFYSKQYGLWGIYAKDNKAMIGISGLWHFFDENQPQLLYALLPGYTKLGYATEASLALIKYAFKQLGFTYLEASCDIPNRESHKVALTIGMKKVKEEIIENKPLTFYRLNSSEI
jgi:ribosomal-protein-alanine N-acetyltransferase